jgi:hypothetical protein
MEKNIGSNIDDNQKQDFLINRKNRDQRLALVFESEQHLLEIGTPVNYHRFGILMLENLPNNPKESENKMMPELTYSPEYLTAFLAQI